MVSNSGKHNMRGYNKKDEDITRSEILLSTRDINSILLIFNVVFEQ